MWPPAVLTKVAPPLRSVASLSPGDGQMLSAMAVAVTWRQKPRKQARQTGVKRSACLTSLARPEFVMGPGLAQLLAVRSPPLGPSRPKLQTVA